jgi:hypothetical protein
MSFSLMLLPAKAQWCEDPPSSSKVCRSRGAFELNSTHSATSMGLYRISSAIHLGRFSSHGTFPSETVFLNAVTWGTSENDIQFADQVVALTDTEDFAMGLFGLSMGKLYFGSDESKETPLTTLKSHDRIASTSYSYTAGNYNR